MGKKGGDESDIFKHEKRSMDLKQEHETTTNVGIGKWRNSKKKNAKDVVLLWMVFVTSPGMYPTSGLDN